jgi:hypothetical protein
MSTNTLNTRLESRLAGYAALATVAIAGAAVTTAEAVIIHSGPVNINVGNNIDGVYLNVVTGAFGTTAGAAPGWDINPYNNGAGLTFFGPTTPTGQGYLSGTGGVLRLTLGAAIGPAGTYTAGQVAGTNFQSFTGQSYFGFRFVNEALGGAINYGWVLIETTASASPNGGFPARILGYAYENNGGAIAAGAIPEPSTTALLGLMAAGALGVRQWRRRKAAK